MTEAFSFIFILRMQPIHFHTYLRETSNYVLGLMSELRTNILVSPPSFFPSLRSLSLREPYHEYIDRSLAPLLERRP